MRIRAGAIALAAMCDFGCAATDADSEDDVLARGTDPTPSARRRPDRAQSERDPLSRDQHETAREVLFTAQYQSRHFLYARLWGVSPDGRRGWIAFSDTNHVPRTPELRWGVDEVDLVHGRLVQRWEETVGGADPDARLVYGTHWPLVDSPEDLVRVATIASTVGNPVLGPQMALSPDGSRVLHHRYGDDRAMGDWLVLRDARSGALVSRFDDPMLASYNPAFSPDGDQVAFTATKPGGGAEGAGPYRVYVQATESGRTGRVKLPEIGHAGTLWWNPAGTEVWAVAPGVDRTQCMWRYEVGPKTLHRVVCAEGLDDVRAVVSEDREQAVLHGRFGSPGEHRSVVVPVTVRDAAVGIRREIDQGTGIHAVRNDGLVIGYRSGATYFWDLERDVVRTLEPGLGGGSRFMKDGSVILGRSAPDSQGRVEVFVDQVWPDRLPQSG